MCYILYGNINNEAYDDLFLNISHKYGFINVKNPTEKDISFKAHIHDGVYFYITYGYCDCRSPIGNNKPGEKELNKYIEWLQEIKKCKKIKVLYILKYWSGSDRTDELKPMVTVNISEIDTTFLAGMAADTFYKIEYFKRYY